MERKKTTPGTEGREKNTKEQHWGTAVSSKARTTRQAQATSSSADFDLRLQFFNFFRVLRFASSLSRNISRKGTGDLTNFDPQAEVRRNITLNLETIDSFSSATIFLSVATNWQDTRGFNSLGRLVVDIDSDRTDPNVRSSKRGRSRENERKRNGSFQNYGRWGTWRPTGASGSWTTSGIEAQLLRVGQGYADEVSPHQRVGDAEASERTTSMNKYRGS